MNDIKGIPYSAAEFDKEGKLLVPPTIPTGSTDLIILSHGWNNDRMEAEELYRKLIENFVAITTNDSIIKQRKIAIVGVIWPSKKFDELMTSQAEAQVARGGALASTAVDKNSAETAMGAAIERAAPLFDDAGDKARLATLRKLIPQLENDTKAQQAFVTTLRTLLDPDGTKARVETAEDGGAIFFRAATDIVFQNAMQGSVTLPSARAITNGGVIDGVGSAASIQSLLSGPVNAVINLLNLTTYFAMKNRAGLVGKEGLAPLIDKLAKQVQRIHLIGHSFGARVVTAGAANSMTNKLHSLALLQAAFSHNAFSHKRNGFFRSVITNKRITGPILISYTKNDRAVGLAYPAASRISRDNASRFGDADDEFGGLGSNGAQQMEEGEVISDVSTLLPNGQSYSWQRGKIHNLESSKFIVDPRGGDAHGWIFVPEVAWAISRAMVA